MSWLTVTLLFPSGVLLAGAFRDTSSWKASIFVLIAMPIVAILDVIVDHSSHNMWPFEFAFYGLLTGVAVVGSRVGLFVRRLIDL